MSEPAIPRRLQDANNALQALSAGHVPAQALARSAVSALDELELALVLDANLLKAHHALRLIADGERFELDTQVQMHAQRLADFINKLAE